MGVLPPGSRVSEFSTAKELRISRAPVREALSQLESEGFVEKIPGFGAFVKVPTLDELGELYEFREALENFAVARAAERINAQQLADLQECCDATKKILGTMRDAGSRDMDDPTAARWIELDLRFHTTILAAAGNRSIERHVTDVRLLGRVWGKRLDSRVWNVFSVLVRSWSDHRRILSALRRHDAQAAQRAMSHHIRETGKRFLRQMRDLGPSLRAWPASEAYQRLLEIHPRAMES